MDAIRFLEDVTSVGILGDPGEDENGEASLRQSGSAFGAAGYGTRKRVPFRFSCGQCF